MKLNRHNRYTGLTYFKCLDFPWVQNLWKKFFCKRNVHLFDEVACSAYYDDDITHYLVCDACGLMVDIKQIDETYIEGD